MRIKITFLGAGSTVFVKNVIGDVFCTPALCECEAARTKKKEDILHAVMLESHTAAELSLADMQAMIDELIEAHGEYMAMYQSVSDV